jgi:hypothetical protein
VRIVVKELKHSEKEGRGRALSLEKQEKHAKIMKKST